MSTTSHGTEPNVDKTELQELMNEFETFLRIKKGFTQKTTRAHVTMARVFLEDVGTTSPTDADVMEFRAQMIDDDYSNSHINNTQKAIEYYFEFADIDELGEYSLLPRKRKKANPYTEEELSQILNHANTLRDQAIVLFLASSGARNSSARRLQFKDIDLEARTAHFEEAKQHNEYTAIFSQRCAEAIQKLKQIRDPEPEDPVFPSRSGGVLTKSGLLQVIQRLGERAGVDNVNVHRFRATFANRLRRNGADIYRIKELMGHRDTRSTLGYLEMDAEELRSEHDALLDGINPDELL
ncbi:tyrosine-type recombinase/integrase [Haloferax marisrubri]|uniref:Integrase n=1 Tax=Haloferax marisrubri TaxID=1544719 RepID=A0A2P4NKZ8_9EURY|nr:site-specific integrase [Haloferax marisrubri]POG53815.1 integrase [Haloferax marisrubri]